MDSIWTERLLSYAHYAYNEIETQSTPVLIALSAATLFVGIKINAYFKHQKFVRTFGEPDQQFAFGPLSIPGLLFRSGLKMTWIQKETLYKDSGKELIIVEPTFWGEPVLYSNSVEVLRQVAGGATHSAWYKPRWSVRATLYWGNNLFAVNEAEWKKHRKIVQPAFNAQTYQLVWHETNRLFNQMIQVDKWPTTPGQTIAFSDSHHVAQKLALYIILSCGFGMPMEWDQETDAHKTKISLTDAVETQRNSLVFLSVAPKWILNLPFKRLEHIRDTVTTLQDWFNQRIAEKKAMFGNTRQEGVDTATLKKDVFSLIAWASQEGGKSLLQDNEIIGNSWVMVFAGHETTAAAIAATLCLLAAHEEEQVTVHEEIDKIVQEAVQEEGDIPFEAYNSLTKTRAVFLESLRLFPAADRLTRATKEDTILRVPVLDGQSGTVKGEKEVTVPKGTVLIADMVGIQRNPRYYPEPERFRPSRWYNAEFDDAFTQFSVGPRKCIGQKFALVESVCFLANILRHYEVLPLLNDGEDLERWKTRVLGNVQRRLTLRLNESPLIFKRR
ncbi:cytochrome P450 [Serendipita vermifera]|nr:cytochrome P450 [Serendipita vermifera]